MSESAGKSPSTPKKRPSRLGRGLSSLMATSVPVDSGAGAAGVRKSAAESIMAAAPAADPVGSEADGYSRLKVSDIDANASQPRQRFDEAALQQLADSVKREGLIQPVVVRPTAAGRYELVAGERRWRAAGLARLEAIPAFVKQLDDRQVAEWALIENLQREDLNPIERAEAFQRLGDSFGLSHEAIAERVGLERSTVTNLLRLLKLSPPVRDMVIRGLLSMGQSRALGGIDDPAHQLALAERVVKEEMSVRQVEAQVKALNQGYDKPAASPKKPARPAYLDDLERQIGEQLSTKVQIKTARKKGAGTLSIDFYNIDQFDELLAKLGVEAQ
ncbi:MAG: ParB/RepB/Spo0J family partition protein [Planctomycetota bacterium]